MRLNVRLTGSTQPVPFDHLHQLTGALHKWLGEQNPEHEGMSLYSFSWLGGGKPLSEGALTFPRGATWFLGFHDSETTERTTTPTIDGALR